MKLHRTALLVTLVSSAATATNPFNNGNGNKKFKTDVSLIISASQTQYDANEPVMLDVTLSSNEKNKPVKLIDWVNPCSAQAKADDVSITTPTEMSFFNIKSTGDDSLAKYLGAVFKRPTPKEEDYTTLNPGETITCSIPVDTYYEFKGKGPDNDTYEITYATSSMQLSTPGQGNAFGQQVETLESNTLSIKVERRKPPPTPSITRHRKKNLRRELQSGSTSFSGGCTSNEQSLLIEARQLALSVSNEVVGHITGVGQAQSSSSCPRYEEWFNAYDPVRHAELQEGYVNIRNQLEVENIVFDCSCNDGSIFAYV